MVSIFYFSFVSLCLGASLMLFSFFFNDSLLETNGKYFFVSLLFLFRLGTSLTFLFVFFFSDGLLETNGKYFLLFFFCFSFVRGRKNERKGEKGTRQKGKKE